MICGAATRTHRRVLTPRDTSAIGVSALVLIAAILLGAIANTPPALVIAIPRGVEGAALKRVAQRFSRHYRGVVEVIALPYEELRRAEFEFVTQGRAGNVSGTVKGFDVILLDDPWMPSLLGEGSPRLAGIPLEPGDGEDFVRPALDVCRGADGQYHALPFVGNSQLLCYRRDAFAPGARASWQALAAWGSKFGSATGGSPFVGRFEPGNSIVSDFMPVLWEFAPDALTGARLARLPDRAADAFAELSELAGLGATRYGAGALSHNDFDLAAYVAKGQAASSIVWSAWAMAIANSAAPHSYLRDQLAFDLPPGRDPKPALGAWLLAVPSNRPLTRRQAIEFVRFATSREQLTLAAEEGNPPPRKSVYRDQGLLARYPFFPVQLTSLTRSQCRVRTPNWRLVETKLGACLWEVTAGLTAPGEALAALNATIDKLAETPAKVREIADPSRCVQ